MRQTDLLNVAVLAFFVYLFQSVQRRRPSQRLQLWIAAWLCAIIHFSVQLWVPRSELWGDAVGLVSVSALLLCGICLILSAGGLKGTGFRRQVGFGLSLPAVALIAWLEFATHPVWAPVAINLAGQAVALIYLWRVYRDRLWVTICGTLLILVCWQWSSYELIRHNDFIALSAILMEPFAVYAILFAHDFPRRSPGVWTTLAGLSAWAAVFPVGVLLDAHPIGITVNPEIWNVPKVVVAFGMLVALLEDELTLTEREREQYRNLFDGNPLPMWVFDKDSMYLLEANAAAVRDFGWAREDLYALTVVDLVSEKETSPVGVVELNWRLAADAEAPRSRSATVLPREVRANAMRFQTRKGQEVLVEVTLQRVTFQGREARLLVTKDITAQENAREQLIHLANHDPLTGLPNRLLLNDRMKTALAAAQRRGAKAAVICVDLDRFKQINDTYGHAAGDSCLREVADRLRQRLRSVDTAARTGGEEFVIILDDVAHARDVERVIEDLLSALAAPHAFADHRIQLSASIGVALYPDDGDESSRLWSMADAAMYRAKQNGGNRHRFSSGSE